jgi:hypothetical protein
VKSEKISMRTWHRKRPIAELQILDPAKFEEVLARCLMGEKKTRLDQEFLGKCCTQVLETPAMISNRRNAIAAGRII